MACMIAKINTSQVNSRYPDSDTLHTSHPDNGPLPAWVHSAPGLAVHSGRGDRACPG